jgi:capsular exopolysaccharide synthesis family protein
VSRFYEAMKRALEQQTELRQGDEVAPPPPIESLPQAVPPIAVPFDADATTPVRRDPLDELEDYLHALPAPAAQAVEASPAPFPLRLAERPAPQEIRPLSPAYERVIQRLVAFRGGRRHCCLLVASAVPGEGASTVARNLAVALGESHRGRVVLVDANLRSPIQHEACQTGTTDGLATVLSGVVALTAALREAPEYGIAVLPAGRPSDIPPHLLTTKALQSVISSLQSQFDWVILDGPPVTTYPDASTLAAVADGTILVLRAERTRSEVAEKAMKVLSDAGAAVLGGVLNGRRYHIPEFIYKRL